MKTFFLILINITLLPSSFSWTKIEEKNGITVWKKETPQSSVVSFKGSVIIDSNIHKVFSVLFDPYHKKEFIQNCKEFELLKVSDLPKSSTSYIKLGNNMPFIDDRDVVIKSKTHFLPKQKAIKVDFWKDDDALKEKKEGVVRISKLEGHWFFKSLKQEKTQVNYQVISDPGGLIPKWLVNLANKNLPYKTLEKMRKLVYHPGKFVQTRTMLKYFFDFSPILGKEHPSAQRNLEEKALVEKRLKAEFKKSCLAGHQDACKMTSFKL